MYIDKLSLTDFRNYESQDFSFPENGLTVIKGQNGHGKSNLMEAIGYVASGRSFRGAHPESMIRAGVEQAIVRGNGCRDGRELLIEAEISASRKNRMMVNRQQVRRSRDLSETILATVFSPDDLEIIKGGPSERRRFIDETLNDIDQKYRSLFGDMERIIRQRNTLLRQAAGRLTSEISMTLDVWDTKFSQVGEQIGILRSDLVEKIQPYVQDAYSSIAETSIAKRVGMQLITNWRECDGGKGLAASLEAERATDLARSITTVGPHRDELLLTINGMNSRSHASQGEQRTLALALKLAAHYLVTDIVGSSPILLLDDVFSELDQDRARFLVNHMPPGQAFLTTAVDLPDEVKCSFELHVQNGRIAA